jgi:hypothetical protein
LDSLDVEQNIDLFGTISRNFPQASFAFPLLAYRSQRVFECGSIVAIAELPQHPDLRHDCVMLWKDLSKVVDFENPVSIMLLKHLFSILPLS